jgi:hypothetical protein
VVNMTDPLRPYSQFLDRNGVINYSEIDLSTHQVNMKLNEVCRATKKTL